MPIYHYNRGMLQTDTTKENKMKLSTIIIIAASILLIGGAIKYKVNENNAKVDRQEQIDKETFMMLQTVKTVQSEILGPQLGHVKLDTTWVSFETDTTGSSAYWDSVVITDEWINRNN